MKDIIDVAGLPTCNGSAACAGAAPASQDAAVVASLRSAGARIVGKTATTEFAFTDPTDCRNPHDLRRSPGGSSSGSGAAVAAGLVDVALGTQTAGSLCRPAAYCGVVGLKPTYDVLPKTGVTPLAPSFDSVGVIARSVEMARAAFQAMAPQAGSPRDAPLSVTRWLLPGDVNVSSDTLAALEGATRAFSRCVNVDVSVRAAGDAPPSPTGCDPLAIVAAHRTVMLAEASKAHGALLNGPEAVFLRPKFRAALEAGADLSADQVRAARQTLEVATTDFWQAMADVDAIVTLPVPEGAPLLGASTGFQDWLTRPLRDA